MKYLSLCSGIEAATVAWHPLGWEAIAYSEIERFPSEVLAHHYPQTPNLGDMTKFKEWTNVSNVDLLVGGTPCQSFSVAGLRKGLDDPRGNLMLTYLAIAKQHRPNWLVWENVPGVLSSNGGRDFGSFLGGLAECGYGFAYRVLDAQYFGVAQRRRRVFVVGYLGDWRLAAAVLFERHSLQGHPAPSREKRQAVAACAGAGAVGGGESSDRVAPQWWDGGDLAATITTKSDDQRMPDKANAQLVMQPIVLDRAAFNQGENAQYKFRAEHSETMDSLVARGPHAVLQPIPIHDQATRHAGKNGEKTMGKGNGLGVGHPGEPMNTLTKGDRHAVAQPIPLDMMNIRGRPSDDGRANRIGRGYGEVGDPMFTITKANHHGVAQPIAVCLGGQHPNAGIGIDQSPTLTEAMGAGGGHIPITFGFDAYNHTIQGQVNQPLRVSSAPGQVDAVGGIVQGMAVRRLTPVECERLQGFPDSYTDIKSKNKPTPDGPRYKALGNSMAVPVMAWIGQRIEQVEAICKQNK
jgi:DNA (cytosine-5)-methyltransferase 1